MADANSFDVLIERFISERVTADELPLFFSFLEEEGFRLRYAERIDLDLLEGAWIGWSNEKQASRIYNNILRAGDIPVSAAAPVVRFRWVWYAAAILIVVIGAAIYRYTVTLHSTEIVHISPPPAGVAQDIPPGQKKAVLILGDKSIVPLDSLARGSIMMQGGMKIVKENNGKIDYLPAQGNLTNSAVISNTVRTPRGGQYQLTLSDGTHVWLNAASSITYPVPFPEAQRTVSISGEVYFEVAKNPKKPFIVDININNRVEVLGTHFNINAYEDEATIRTTLLEGIVKITGENVSVMLMPGQQASGTQVSNRVDLDQVMAWKSGIFSFEDKSVQQVLRELARWYDLTITYGKDIRDIKLRGEMGMNLNLSQVLKGLAAMEVPCRLEPGKKLIVFP